jgi:hypothetical protein
VNKPFFSFPSMMKPVRRLQNQQQFAPTNSYSSVQDQQPIVADQQYGQSLNQQQKSKTSLLTKKNTMF